MNEFGSLGFNKSLVVSHLRRNLSSSMPEEYKLGYKHACLDLISLWFTKKEKDYLLKIHPDLFPM